LILSELIIFVVPWLLCSNSRVAENLGSCMSLVGGNGFSLWGIAIAHYLLITNKFIPLNGNIDERGIE
jgi:hypothetical protein